MSSVLELNIGTGRRGAMELALTRELTQGDLDILAQPQGCIATTPKKIRETHHQLARLLAQGIKQVEVSAITGFSQSRISILQTDPAFKELVEHYREVKTSSFADVNGQIVSLGVDVIGELRDRLHDQPEDFKNRELMEFATSLLDRSGFGPTAKMKLEQTSIHVTGAELLKLKQIAQEMQCGHVTTELNARTIECGAQENSQLELGGVVPLRPEIQKDSTEGKSSEGDDV